MRAPLIPILLLSLLARTAWAQPALEAGSPEAAFSGGPIKLSKAAAGLLRTHFGGDRVPLIPQPFRGRLDTAMAARDWPRVEAAKKELVAARGIVTMLAWEQSRFIATGGIGIAEMHALDVAATGSTGVSETAAMMWLYAVAVTMTDGRKCADAAPREAHLDRLRGPEFEPVTRIVRTLSDDRLAAMRDLAIRLETVLAADRMDDTMCRTGATKPELKPDSVWRPEAASTRAMLPRHLQAICAVMRPAPIAAMARPEPPKHPTASPLASKPVTTKPQPVAAPATQATESADASRSASPATPQASETTRPAAIQPPPGASAEVHAPPEIQTPGPSSEPSEKQ